ncbi:MBL fold metallo-hydrolase [Rhabdothermincola sp.]|uniref:MBL fold metallo-hydrolase n=1 Tax=Rhabdothermincola sp. TaxID=2820405 RepID=UPI002FE2F0FC
MGGHLQQLAPGVHTWLSEPAGHGQTNAGVIVDDDGVTLIDCLLAPALAAPLAEEIAASQLPVRRVVYTSSHVEFTGGSSVFWMAARYGRRQTSALLDQPANPAVYRALYPDHAQAFDDDFATRPVSHTVDTAAWLSPTVCALPTAGQQHENLVALLPAADVLFAGAMCSFGVTPNAFDGDPEAWADALSELAGLATTIVPGIGPVGGADDLLALQAYLYSCVEAGGDPSRVPPGPWDRWADRHLDAVNVERAAMLAAGDDGVPPSMLRLAGLA